VMGSTLTCAARCFCFQPFAARADLIRAATSAFCGFMKEIVAERD
jgi:hypothetical protein